MKNTVFLAAIFVFALASASFARDYEYRSAHGEPPPELGGVELQRLLISIPPAQFEHGLDVEKMEDFCGDIAKVVFQESPETAGAFELVVKVTLSKQDKPKYQVSSDDKVTDQTIDFIAHRPQF